MLFEGDVVPTPPARGKMDVDSPSRPNRSSVGMVQRTPSRPAKQAQAPAVSSWGATKDSPELIFPVSCRRRRRLSNGDVLERGLFVLGFICLSIFFMTWDPSYDEAEDFDDIVQHEDKAIIRPGLIIESMKNDEFHPHWNGNKCELSRYGEGQLPSVLVLGVHKGGSTALFSYLAAHGSIRPSYCKETHFLDWKYANLLETRGGAEPTIEVLRSEYARFFRPYGEQPGTISMEGTPSYFFGSGDIAERARRLVPDARLVVALRNPVDRTISHFMGWSNYQKQWTGSNNCSSWFTSASQSLSLRCDALRPRNLGFSSFNGKMSPEMLAAWTTYSHCVLSSSGDSLPVARSIYSVQLFNWVQQFAPERIYLLQSESLFYHTHTEMDRLTEWMGIRPHLDHEKTNFVPIGSSNMKRFNLHHVGRQTGRAKARFAARFDCIKKEMNTFYAKYEDELWDLLLGYFPDVPTRWMRWSVQSSKNVGGLIDQVAKGHSPNHPSR